MRAVHFEDAEVSDDFVHFMETCVQCRGCEPACPSGVPFGQLMEGTRDTLAGQKPDDAVVAAARATACSATTACCSPGRRVLAVAQRLRLVPKRMGLPQLPLRRGARRRRPATTPGCSPGA